MDDRLTKRKARGLRSALEGSDADFEQRLRKRDEDARKRSAAGSNGWTPQRRAKLAEKKATIREATERKAAAREAVETEVAEQNAGEGFLQAQLLAAESESNHNADDVRAGAGQLAFNHRSDRGDGVEPHVVPGQPKTDAETVESIEGGRNPAFIAQDNSNGRQDVVDDRQEEIPSRALVGGNRGEALPVDDEGGPVGQDQSEGDSNSRQRLPDDITPLVQALRAHGSGLNKIDAKLNRANVSYRKAEAKMRALLDDIFSIEAEFEDIMKDLKDEDMTRDERANVYDPFFDARDRVVELRQRLEARREQLRTDRRTLELALVEKVARLTPLGDNESSVAGSSESSELEAPLLQQEVDFSMQRTNLEEVERWVRSDDAPAPPSEGPTPPKDQWSDISSVRIGDEPDSDRNLITSIQSKRLNEVPQQAASAAERSAARSDTSAAQDTDGKAVEQPMRDDKAPQPAASSIPTDARKRKRNDDDARSENEEDQ